MLLCHLRIISVFKKTYINQQTLEAGMRASRVAPDKLTGMGETLTLALTKFVQAIFSQCPYNRLLQNVRDIMGNAVAGVEHYFFHIKK